MAYRPRLLEVLRDTIIGTVQRYGPDLTCRQLAVLLVCSLEDSPQTVRGLARLLRTPKPAITRAIDRLEKFGLAKRAPDKRDRRSVLISPTEAGRAFTKELHGMMTVASAGQTSGA